MTATKAAKRSSEEKTRRQRDGVNVEVKREFVIMIRWFGLIRDRKLKLRFLTQGGARCQTFFLRFSWFWTLCRPSQTRSLKGERVILFPSVEAAVPAATMLTAGDTPATTDPQVGNPLTSENRIAFHLQTGTRELSLASSRI